MPEDALDIYCDAFVAPRRHELDSAPLILIVSGVRGVAVIRLLVADDSGFDRVVAEVAGPWPGVIFVLERASRCHDFLRSQPGWTASHSEMAMVLRDVEVVRSETLPDGLDLRPVNLASPAVPDAVPLRDAAAVAVASDLSITDSLEGVAGFLSALPPSVRLFAAVDKDGVAHATSACHVFGEYAQVFFVNTEPGWRRRGIGQAMTAAALRAAAALGARRAILHATDHGLSVYKRLGFEAVGLLTRYSRAE